MVISYYGDLVNERISRACFSPAQGITHGAGACVQASLSPCTSLASSEATLWQSQPQPSTRLLQCSSSESWRSWPAQRAQDDWSRPPPSSTSSLDRGRALSLAIQKVLQTPRVQLKVRSAATNCTPAMAALCYDLTMICSN